MKITILSLFMAFSVTSWGATNQWSFVNEAEHSYWQEKSCYSYIELNAPTGQTAVFEVYNSKEKEFARPFIQVITEGMPTFYEAVSYFDNKPHQGTYEMIRVQKEGEGQKQVLALPLEDEGDLAEYLKKIIKKNAVYVEIKNKDGVIQKLRFSLRKSSINVRKTLNNCFVNLSQDIQEV